MHRVFPSSGCCPAIPSRFFRASASMSPERHAEISHQLGLRPADRHPVPRLSLEDPARRLRRRRSPPRSRCWASSSSSSRRRSELSLCAIIFAIVLGIPAGVLAAIKRGSILDQLIMGTALIGFSMPIFWWGPAPDHPVLRHIAMDAGVGPHLADVLLPVGDRASCWSTRCSPARSPAPSDPRPAT